jgi:hypothetical protein
MKTIALLSLLGCLALSGCAHNYVITLNNGSRFTTSTKPRLERGNYYFTDMNGRKSYVPGGRVREIAPASMASDEASKFKPASN